MTYDAAYYEHKEAARARTGEAVADMTVMTSAEHAATAAKLLAGIWTTDVRVEGPLRWDPPSAYDLAVAQVHATLALVKKPVVEPEEPPREPWHAFLTGRWAR
jgi:hypothetical protein